MRLTILLAIALLVSSVFGISQWAAAGLPLVTVADGDGIATTYLGKTEVWPRDKLCHDGTKIGFFAPVAVMDSFTPRYIATLNVDETWSIAPWRLLRHVVTNDLSHDDFSWRVLLAYPVLHTTSMAHGLGVNSHFCQNDPLVIK